MNQRLAVGILLVVSALILLTYSSVPTQPTQVSVTTTLPTSTTVVTTYSKYVTSTSCISNCSPLDYAYLSPLTPHFSGSKILNPPSAQYGCTYDDANFEAQSGQVYAIAISSDHEVSFYILPSDAFEAWMAGTTCQVSAIGLGSGDVTSASSLNFVIPESGTYYILFMNNSHDNAANLSYLGQMIGSATVTTAVVTTSSVWREYLTSTETSNLSPSATTSLFSSSRSLVFAAIAFLLIALAGALFIRQRLWVKGKTRRIKKAGTKSCPICNSLLPESAQFCDECGSHQT